MFLLTWGNGGGRGSRELWIGSLLLHLCRFGASNSGLRNCRKSLYPLSHLTSHFGWFGFYWRRVLLYSPGCLEFRIVCLLSAGIHQWNTPAAAEVFLNTNLLSNSSTLLFFWAWLFPPRPTVPVSTMLPADGQSWKAGLSWPLGLHLLPAHCSLAGKSDKLACTGGRTKDF